MIIIDSREKRYFTKELDNSEVKYERQYLDFGDILIHGYDQNYIMERKTIFDFAGSVMSGRLWDQLKGLEKYDNYNRVLLIEGIYGTPEYYKILNSPRLKPYYQRSGVYNFSETRYLGALTSVAKSWNMISILVTRDPKQTVQYIKTLDTKLGDPEAGSVIIRNDIKKEVSTSQEILNVICGFGGIGYKTATKLMKDFKSLESVFGAKETQIADVIGKSKAKHLKQMWSAKYEE